MEKTLTNKLKLSLATAIAATMLGGCLGDDLPAPKTTDAPYVFNLENAKKVLNTNADIALASYEDSVDTAKLLQTAIATFKATPTADNLKAAKKAWLVSREPYGQTEVYRFRASPIDSTTYPDDNEEGPEGAINAWPLGEALIDYVTTGTDFGDDQVVAEHTITGIPSPIVTGASSNNIINSTAIAITEALLENSEAGSGNDVISGYHAIEFMLWGQDLNTTNDGSVTPTTRDASGGQRPLADFTTAANADRRHQFLKVVAEKLVSDLEGVRDGWKAGATYRTAFTTINNETEAKEKFTEILSGMGTLSEGELAGERMQIAYSANSQEDEHSCFSDNTHRDIWLNAEGVSNSYYGKYEGYDSTQDGIDDNTTRAVTDGYGFNDYLTDAKMNKSKANLEAAFTKTETNYKAIASLATGGQPVDQQIMPENRGTDKPMAKTIVSLNAQSSVIQELATTLGLGDVVDDEGSACDTTNPATECP